MEINIRLSTLCSEMVKDATNKYPHTPKLAVSDTLSSAKNSGLDLTKIFKKMMENDGVTVDYEDNICHEFIYTIRNFYVIDPMLTLTPKEIKQLKSFYKEVLNQLSKLNS